MADIALEKKHGLSKDAAKDRLAQMADTLRTKYGIRSEWDGDVCRLSGTGIKSGTLTVTDDAIRLEVALGMLAKAMKGTIEQQVNKEFDKLFS